ncbi:MAG: low molecular weight phosphotyrosine protein phosphatase [Clostridiales bacterium]|nr:low molecular weight phosphotyrosine protein phosphatase [Clostridiales bacterium]
MLAVAFVCLGNICRSPMAELIFLDLAKRAGVSSKLLIDSFGTSDEEEGNGIYPPALKVLSEHGIYGSHTAKQMTLPDVMRFDYILVMEERNRTRLVQNVGGKYADKIKRLCDYTARPRDVADPWYTRDFDKAFNDIYDGCKAFLEYLIGEKKLD